MCTYTRNLVIDNSRRWPPSQQHINSICLQEEHIWTIETRWHGFCGVKCCIQALQQPVHETKHMHKAVSERTEHGPQTSDMVYEILNVCVNPIVKHAYMQLKLGQKLFEGGIKIGIYNLK